MSINVKINVFNRDTPKNMFSRAWQEKL